MKPLAHHSKLIVSEELHRESNPYNRQILLEKHIREVTKIKCSTISLPVLLSCKGLLQAYKDFRMSLILGVKVPDVKESKYDVRVMLIALKVAHQNGEYKMAISSANADELSNCYGWANSTWRNDINKSVEKLISDLKEDNRLKVLDSHPLRTTLRHNILLKYWA